MTRHVGNNGKVTLASGAVAGLDSFDITEPAATHDLSAAGDPWEVHGGGLKKWEGSITMKADHGATGQDLRAGDSVAFQGYTEGDATGKTFYSGTATITSHGLNSPKDGAVVRTYSIMGNGALAIATVS